MLPYTDDDLFRMLTAPEPSRSNAFAELYARYSSRIYLYCRKILSDERLAEDVFQETFLSFLQHADRGGEVRHVSAFLLRIARNACLNAHRDTRRAHTPFEDFHAPSLDRPLESLELERMIEAALQSIPEEHREALVLQMYDGLSYAEIADVTGVPVSTVRNRVVRGKKKLREMLSEYVGTMRS